MLYYIDMCAFFVCSRLCCFSLLYDFVGQITWYQYIYDMHFWVYFDIYIYIYIMFCWVELFEFHCVQSISYLYYIFDMYFCVIRSVKPHRNCKKPTYDNKHKQEPTWNLSNNKKNWTNMFKKNFLELIKWAAWASTHVYSQMHLFYS